MKRDEIMAMEAGRKIDELIAEKITGMPAEYFASISEYRYYSDNIAAAWAVVEKIRSGRFSKRQRFTTELQNSVSHGMKNGHKVAWPDVLWLIKPLDVCKAALLVMCADSDETKK